jgi:hypothetical protein
MSSSSRSSLFRKPPEDKIESWEFVSPYSLPPAFSEKAQILYQALLNSNSNNRFRTFVFGANNFYVAGKCNALYLNAVHASKVPGSITRNGKKLDFNEAEYLVDIFKTGELSYQIKFSPRNAQITYTFPIALNDIPDAEVKEFHQKYLSGLLVGEEKKIEKENACAASPLR